MGEFHLADRRCERARAWASLELDDELSPLERALLRAHVGRCSACAAAVAEMRALTEAVRETPLEHPSSSVFRGDGKRHRRRSAVAVRVAIAAVLAALAAGLGVTVTFVGRDDPARPPSNPPDLALLPQEELRDISRPNRNAPTPEDRRFGTVPSSGA